MMLMVQMTGQKHINVSIHDISEDRCLHVGSLVMIKVNHQGET